jgi:aspartyl-tRNA(Asn)/glutamyl-tRNA(Gln) amidotransferase subunit A
VPAGGIIPLSWSIDHIGPITRNAADAAVMLNVLAGEDFLDAAPVPRPGTIGVVPEVLEDSDPLVAAACEGALMALEKAGWSIREIEGPTVADLELSNSLGLLVSRSEAAAFHRSIGTDLDLCIPEVRDQLRAGLTITAADYLDAQRQRERLCAATLAQFGNCDIIVSPTSPLVAPLKTDYERYLLRLSRNTIIWSLLGSPAVSLPCGTGEAGLPVGLQLAAAPGREQVLVDAGIALETVLSTHD